MLIMNKGLAVEVSPLSCSVLCSGIILPLYLQPFPIPQTL
jgi:hypothetical protein